MAKQLIGIQANLLMVSTLRYENGIFIQGGQRFRQDQRSVSKVEQTRDMVNRKPWRNKEQKAQARAESIKEKKGKYRGTFVSFVPRITRNDDPRTNA